MSNPAGHNISRSKPDVIRDRIERSMYNLKGSILSLLNEILKIWFWGLKIVVKLPTK